MPGGEVLAPICSKNVLDCWDQGRSKHRNRTCLSRPWANGGPTPVKNHQLPNGDYLWTSRLGHTYATSRLPP